MSIGIITKGISGKYIVYDGSGYHECSPRGIFRKEKITPLPGDKVGFDNDTIKTVYKRKNKFIRPAVANVDQMAFFISVSSPEPDFYLLDKMIITAFYNDVDILLCVNKNDIDDNDMSARIKSIYGALGIKVIIMSALNGPGVDGLYKELENKITVLSGQSGAGKSTALNCIFQKEIMETGNVSRKTERGKHTTRHSELFKFKEGFIADTPGFSSYELPDIDKNKLKNFYPEFEKYSDSCKFKECIHINEPGCGVKQALEDGIIDQGRYNRYIKLWTSLQERNNYG